MDEESKAEGHFEWYSRSFSSAMGAASYQIPLPDGLPDFAGSNLGVAAVIIPLRDILRDRSVSAGERSEIARSQLVSRLPFDCLPVNMSLTDEENGTVLEFQISLTSGNLRGFRFGF